MPWIFLCLMLVNVVYFGWGFMNSVQPQVRVTSAATAQGGRIRLLSESPELQQAAAQGSEPAEAMPVPVAAAVPQCFNVGPFATEGVLQSFASAMRAKRFVVRVDKRKVDEKDFWVFIPAFTTRAKAEERLRELKARGIDGYVVKDGVFINSISLNHFSRKELAQSFLEQMQAAGVTVEYRELSRPGMEQWVYLEPGPSKAELRDEIDGFLAKHEGLKRENASCEE